MLNGLDLFSGIGGNSLALAPWVNTVAYCEREPHAQAVLLSRMREGLLPSRPIWDDVSSLRGEWLPPIDIIIGGFPCQDISVAGKGAGLEGQRSGLFFEICRLAEEVKPAFLFLENVPAIRTRGLGRVIDELTALGYDLRWTMLSAEEVGAPHKRDRWFCLAAHPERLKLRFEQGRSCGTDWQGTTEPGLDGAEESLANSNGDGSFSPVKAIHSSRRSETMFIGTDALNCPSRFSGWTSEPDVGRVVDGVPFRVDRLKRLGNAVVPLQAREAFKELMGIE